MRLVIADWKWACIDAAVFLGIAAFIVFVIRPGGFEGQGAWFFLLLPGAIPAAFLSDLVYKIVPAVEPAINWLLIVGISFAWYWPITYAVIKTFRKAGWELGSPEF